MGIYQQLVCDCTPEDAAHRSRIAWKAPSVWQGDVMRKHTSVENDRDQQCSGGGENKLSSCLGDVEWAIVIRE